MFGVLLWVGGLLTVVVGGLFLYQHIVSQLSQALR